MFDRILHIAFMSLLFSAASACGDDAAQDAGAADARSPTDSGDEPDAPESDASEQDASDPDTAADAVRVDVGPPIDSGPAGPGGSIRFYGNGGERGDRVLIRLDDPSSVEPGPPVDVGATDFTIEFWMLAREGNNANPAIACGENNDWVTSNIIIDRDRHSQAPTFGIGIAGRRLVWAVQGPGGSSVSHCGAGIVDDGSWHHVAVQRRRSDGRMWIWLDGALDFEGAGPAGDISYPDDGVPMNRCPSGVCDYSDPFLALGAEKHGYEGISYNGWLDEMRISTTLRYESPFSPSSVPFASDANTVGLYHFDEGSGTAAADSSGRAGDQNGELIRGGDPTGPDWSAEHPF